MELEVFDIIVFVTGIIVGFAGALVLRAVSKKSSHGHHPSTGATIDALQHELERRQVLVDDHFLQLNAHILSAEKKLADARKTVQEGASTLSTVQLSGPEEADGDAEVEESNLATPPRDYAAKGDADEGMLSENFGLHHNETEEPKRTI